jgi:hypothetical protein
MHDLCVIQTFSLSDDCGRSTWKALRSRRREGLYHSTLTPVLLTWRIWWDSNNASKWQMGFNWAFKGLKFLKWRHVDERFLVLAMQTWLKRFYLFRAFIKKKGKAVPLQVWSGPEGCMKLRFPDYMTTAQDGGKVVSLTHRPPLPPGNAPGTHFC